jgi:hypothetical protein
MVYMRFTLDRSTPSPWRVTFSHPPINLIDSVMIGELGAFTSGAFSRAPSRAICQLTERQNLNWHPILACPRLEHVRSNQNDTASDHP